MNGVIMVGSTRCTSRWVAALVIACGLLAARTPTQAATTAPATQPGFASVPILQLRGSGADMGTQQGHTLREPIRQLFHLYFTRFIQTDAERIAALAGAAIFETELTPEYRAEVHALALATDLGEQQVMLAQCFLDLSAMTGCSTIALPGGASPDGVPRMGRNLDFFSFDVADKATVLLVYHPTGKYAFASIAWPGMIGVLSGMNEKGLCLANMEVARNPRWPSALPYTLLYRSILEECGTVDEAIELLRKTPRQTANNLMLMDARGDRAVAEITPESVHIRRAPTNQGLVCTNHQRGDDLDTPGRCWRYDRLHDEAKEEFGAIAVEQIKKMLATAAQGEMTMQSMIFEPENRALYLATGKEATLRPYSRFELAPLLEKR
jgi:isopenicillin-N N-acyltransferase-like protein